MSVEVRPATVGDLDVLVLLNAPVQRLHAGWYPADFKAEADAGEVKRFFRACLAMPDQMIVVAEAGREAVGYLWFELWKRKENAFRPARRCVYIHQVAVRPDARRHGVGTALLRFVEEQALSRGIPEIVLDTWAANGEAHRFFSALGFEASTIVLRRAVGAGQRRA